MKTIATLVLATLSLAAVPAAKADDYFYATKSYHCAPDYSAPHYCAPRYVSTQEICRHTECRYFYDHCGRRHGYELVVITYADYYSDGSSRTYTRTYRA